VDWPLEGAVPLGDEYYQSVRQVARHGWQLMEHSFNERITRARRRLGTRPPRVPDHEPALEHRSREHD
jgi:hypothetical protein